MKRCIAILTVVVLGVGGTLSTSAGEWEKSTPYYEDDAWYDISEWFDGNDYNPTDEEFGEWDDETYQVDDDVDTDDDRVQAGNENDRWYGYNTSTNANDNWFYDYYDYGNDSYDKFRNGLYLSGMRYYDYDNDGTYDAFASWHDRDADGLYDDYNFYTLSEDSPESKQKSNETKKSQGKQKQPAQGQAQQREQQAQQEVPKSSRSVTISGEVEATKKVNVRGNEHLVAAIKHDGKSMPIDLGRADQLKDVKLDSGQKVTASGMKLVVGDKSILLVRTLDVNGKQVQIDRQRRQFHGEVVSTRKAKVVGREHLIAIVKGDKGNKVAVDFGPADKLNVDIAAGQQLTFSGAPVKVKNKSMLMANSIQHDGQTVPIDRGQRPKNKQASS